LENEMRAILVTVTVLVGISGLTTREAGAYEWCAFYDPYTHNCGFRTFEQCLATISGVGGVCRRNPFPQPVPAQRELPRRERR
jgi:hypothetical protein